MLRKSWVAKIVMWTAFSLTLSALGCSRVGFKSDKSLLDQQVSLPDLQDLPPIPPVVVPIPTPMPVEKNGFCESGQNISACLKCEGKQPPPLPPPPPQLSQKAQELAKILSLSCSIQNKSDPVGYSNYPTLAQIEKRLESCTTVDYPVTPTSEAQRQTLDRLLSADPEMRQKFFSGLWYRPPYTDHFELYFGVESIEARRIFCYRNDRLDGDLLTSEYWHSCRNSRDDCSSWKSDAQAQKRWQDAQKIRSGLKVCLDRPLAPQTPTPTPPSSPALCLWKSFEGPREDVEKYGENLKTQGFRVSFQDQASCKLDEVPSDSNWMQVTGYRCP